MAKQIIFKGDMEYDLFEDFMEFDLNHIKCEINGTLGLWDGKKTIHPVQGELSTLIQKAVNDMDYFEIHYDSELNRIYVDSFHHDGVNRFEIKPIDEEEKLLNY